MPDSAQPAVRGKRLSLEHVSHVVFFLVLGGALAQLARLHHPLCWYLVTVSALLALVYATGLALLDRLGPLGRGAWVPSLLLLWGVLVFISPAPLTPAYGWCSVPLACAALRVLGRRSAPAAVAAITVVLGGALLRSEGWSGLEAVLVPVAAVWGTVALYRAQQRDAAARQRLVEELRDTRDVLAKQQRQAGVLAERTRIARDLHDTLAQELAGSLMLLQAAERDWEKRPEVARTRVRAVTEGLDGNLAETRRILRDLTPADVAEAGLDSALRLLCARFPGDGTAARVQFRSVGEHRPVLDEHAAGALFRVAQSSLANVREHSRAVNVLVTLRRQPGQVDLEVSDDGIGFDPAEVFAAAPRTGRGFGMPAARARLREYGGDLEVSSSPGQGTTIRASVSVGAGLRAAAQVTQVTAG
ncbi:histidine kinase [Streptomyces sp. NPDC058274]|uniref:histidine kinase n=1 Tax=Streptomyces sp. NPDC058274 TaxID=3346416 RepID=UPI0036E76B4F